MAGAPVSVGDNALDVQEAASFAVEHISAMSNSLDKLALHAIMDAKRQVVAGINYYLTLDVRTPHGNTQQYDVVVYKNLQNVMKVTSMKIHE
eukprot:CAMPEP_0196651824 /NCGR_PEP_ID=MMETSP1086-20130531/962_1 /TAXON_ID=77921 /ORGANISM="Cyanoptyche  gloeocystis , Strain SAG4.97" /LENGTH=91 /DNA_ID=CAMNT_0041982049 /DNA_START=96 /DNA_END=371 /DNA_ORIENTATION=-